MSKAKPFASKAAATRNAPTAASAAASPVLDEAPSVHGGPALAADLAAWKDHVQRQETRCAAESISAAVLSIVLPPAAAGSALDARRIALQVISPGLRPSDIIGLISASELALVLLPVESILDAQQRVRDIDAALRGAGVVAAIGWAMRQHGRDLFHAAARADAAAASVGRKPALDLR